MAMSLSDIVSQLTKLNELYPNIISEILMAHKGPKRGQRASTHKATKGKPKPVKKPKSSK